MKLEERKIELTWDVIIYIQLNSKKPYPIVSRSANVIGGKELFYAKHVSEIYKQIFGDFSSCHELM